MAAPNPTIIHPLCCTAVEIVPGRKDAWDEHDCGRAAQYVCISCGDGVCIGCDLPCFECGEHLHDMCRENHADETGHDVNGRFA